MPELPEVETMVRGIRGAVAGRRLLSVRKCRCSCKPIVVSPSLRSLQQRSKNSVITSVDRLGKRVLLHLNTKDTFVIEPRMTGLMLLADPPDKQHLRLKWELTPGSGQQHSALWFWDRRGLGTVQLLSANELNELRNEKLGPDALQLTAADWRELRSRTSRAIKVALLDQKLIAGIGNLYASEILHRARISPFLPFDQLSDGQCQEIARATREILELAIEYEGSTLGDGTYRNALNRDGSYQNEHRVYMRADEVCPQCDFATIIRTVQAQRSTFYCPQCQPLS